MRKLILDQIPYDEVKDVVRHLLRKGIDADSLVDRPLIVAIAKAIIASVRKES